MLFAKCRGSVVSMSNCLKNHILSDVKSLRQRSENLLYLISKCIYLDINCYRNYLIMIVVKNKLLSLLVSRWLSFYHCVG